MYNPAIVISDWAHFENDNLPRYSGSVLSPHSIRRHVLTNTVQFAHKSKFVRRRSRTSRRRHAQTQTEIIQAAKKLVKDWIEEDFRSGHPRYPALLAPNGNSVTINIRRGNHTGAITLQTPRGTFTYYQTCYTIVVDTRTGIVTNAFPSGPGYGADGNSIFGRGNLPSLYLASINVKM